MYKINYPDNNITKIWSEYQEKRNLGLKKEANKTLNKLIAYILNLNNEKQSKFVDYICSKKFEEEEEFHLQFPLVSKVIFPHLLSAIDQKKMPQIRWLYQLKFYQDYAIRLIEEKVGTEFSDEKILKLANQISPNDEKTIKLLLDLYFDSLWYGSHHFPEFILLNKKIVIQILSDLKSIIKKYCDSELINNDLIADYEYYEKLYYDWFKFTESKEDLNFEEWCKKNNKNYTWVKSYYYER